MKKTMKPSKDQLIIIALSVMVLVLLVFCLNAFRTDASPVTGTTTPVKTTLQQEIEPTASTTVPAPDDNADVAPTQTTKPADTTAPVQIDETEEILKVVSDSVNLLKSDKANFTGHKVQNINIHLVDSSVPAVNNIINGVIKAFVKEETLDYDFTNGISQNPEGDGTVDGNNTFPPGDKPFELTKEGVASATKTVEGENTVYTVVIVHETSTLENPRPPHHNAGADTLDLSSVEMAVFPGGMPGSLNLDSSEYTDRVISAMLDKGGKLAAICAAPLIFGRRGVLRGKHATCFPGFESELVGATVTGENFVTDGNITTGKGMTFSLEFSRELVRVLKA